MNMLLAIDGGSTKTISVVFDEEKNEIVSVGLSGSANYTTNSLEFAIKNLSKSINDAIEAADITMDSIEKVIVSIVGIGDSEEATKMGNEIISSLIGKKEYSVINDGLAAYFLGNGGKNGIVFAPGTGSVGYVKVENRMKRFGGWGWSIGDMSSATWFSKKSVEIAMMEMDSESSRKPFLETVENHFKTSLRELSWQIERRYIQKEKLASFSVNLSRMAKDGNKEALALFDESASYMGRIINGIRSKYSDAKRVSIMGGTMQAGEFYYKMIRKYIPDVNIFFGYEIVIGTIMHMENEMDFRFRDSLLKQLDHSLDKIPEDELKGYLNIDKPMKLP
ncbi:BadF/BadG/BcrA/BcrD ATPase family protein [Cuniculiplasma divulgatum]|jgi:N-acetylglucosamine kinase-like BadF-type ATPase|uniref:Predicted N-acetylglucosamine kinase n=1 Tax=Cuniculiplasma divulgatum TaxID=1673428 RepID=A0A1R4A8X8_9ARCH|nr:BadF/BadG/BcrA/BcrD ATPase family protein [Cuniculiplasma divulgatum]MCI2413303.1 N-acetylglucosamine kinase [Cuniculiplasma sp.]SJK85422.1 predicted N-acetylglucosamine kinase [Cuniculiplasma divulgatum]